MMEQMKEILDYVGPVLTIAEIGLVALTPLALAGWCYLADQRVNKLCQEYKTGVDEVRLRQMYGTLERMFSQDAEMRLVNALSPNMKTKAEKLKKTLEQKIGVYHAFETL